MKKRYLLFVFTFFIILIYQPLFGQVFELGLPEGQNTATRDIKISPNNKLIVTTYNSMAYVWNIKSGRLIYKLSHDDDVFTAEFSSDGAQIVTASADNTAKIWDVNSGKLIHTFEGHKDKIRSAEFNYSNHLVITASLDNSAKIWNTSNGKLLISLDKHTDYVYSAKFSSDGKLVVTSSADDTAKIWDAKSGELLHNLKGHKDRVTSAIFSPNDKLIITASKDNTSRIWNVMNGEMIHELRGSGWIKTAEFNRDSDLVITSSRNGIVRLWDVKSGKIKNINDRLTRHGLANFSPNGKYILVGKDYEKNVKLFNTNSGELIHSLEKTKIKNPPRCAAFSEDSKILAVGFMNGGIKIWNTITGDLIQIFKKKTELVKIAKLSPKNKYIFTHSEKELVVNEQDNEGRILDLNSAKLFNTLEGNTNNLRSIRFSRNGKTLLASHYYDFAKMWDVNSGKLINSFYNSLPYNDLNITNYSADGKYLLTAQAFNSVENSNFSLKIWETGSKKVKHKLQDIESGVLSAQFSPDNNFVFASFVNDKPSKIWDVNTGKLKFTLKGHIDSNKQGQFSNDGKYILTTEYDKVHYNVHLWDIKSEKLVHTLQSETGIRFSQFSPNSKYILIYYFDNTLKLFDVKSKKLIYSINTSVLSDEIHFSLNNKFLVMTELGSKTLKIYNTINGKIIYELIGHEDFIFSIHISNDNNFILSSSADGSIIIWDINTGEKLVQSFMFDNKNQMWLLPNGYYMASKAAASKLYYKKGLQTIGFEQLDVKFNRPDKVLEVLGDITGERNTQLLNAYKKAWEKRIRKLEIDTTSFRQGFSVPESNFINRDAITYEQSKQELKLHIKALDSTYRLDRFNVWINEVPVYGRKGISLKSKNTHSVDTTLTVKLSVGKNKIETSVLNVNGIESYRQPLYVNFTPKEEVKEKLFFVGIGVDKYQEEGHDLNYSVKDIKDLSIQLKKKYGNLLEIDTLFNQNVSVSNIMKLKERLQNTTVDDKVIISFSGHGLLSKDLDYYLATHDVNFDTPEQNGLPYEDLEYLLDGIPSRKKLLLIDACHSGELDKEDVESIHQVEQQKEGLKGSIGVRVKKPKMGMKNSFELMKELFNNVDRATGATVISAAAGTQFAQERGELKNGVFTYCILNQLREKETISVSELKTLVGKQVQEITNGLQQPTSRNETIENNWKVW